MGQGVFYNSVHYKSYATILKVTLLIVEAVLLLNS